MLDVAFHPSHTCVVTASMGAVKAWAAERDPDVLRGHMDDVTSVAYAPDGAWFVSAGVGGVVRRWDANTGEQARAWIGHRWSVTALAVSPDARLVAAGDATGEVLLWDVERDEVALRIDAHEGAPVHDLAFRHDGTRLATAGADGRLAVWDVATGKPLATVRATDGSLGCVEVTPDDRYVLTGDASGAVRVWDAATLAPVRDLSPHGDLVTGIDCCATRGLVATVSQDDTLRLWNLDDGSLRRVTPLPSPLDVAFSPDGSRLAAGCMDGTVRLFDTASGRLVATLQHVDWVYAVAWSRTANGCCRRAAPPRSASGARDRSVCAVPARPTLRADAAPWPSSPRWRRRTPIPTSSCVGFAPGRTSVRTFAKPRCARRIVFSGARRG